MRIIIFLLFTIIYIDSIYAAQLPRFLGSEKKFRAFVYNPNEVYRYTGHFTYLGFIEFGKTESISAVTLGNEKLWMHKAAGNRLFLKPVEDNPETNMTVFTSGGGKSGGRAYHFELKGREADGIDDEKLVFVVKFIYPDDANKNIIRFAKGDKSIQPDMRKLSRYNFDYEFTGEITIAPIKVFDDGKFTYFQFSKKNAEIPAIFSVDPSGYESLVNFKMAGDYMIAEITSPQFTLRNGKDIVCVYNNRMLKNKL